MTAVSLDVPGHLALPVTRRAHSHAVTVNGRWVLRDRCRSALLWATVARAVVQGAEVRVDGEPVVWGAVEARAYVAGLPPAMAAKWGRGLPAEGE